MTTIFPLNENGLRPIKRSDTFNLTYSFENLTLTSTRAPVPPLRALSELRPGLLLSAPLPPALPPLLAGVRQTRVVGEGLPGRQIIVML